MHTRTLVRRLTTTVAMIGVSSLSTLLVACDQETSKSKTTETKVVDTPEGKKKVTERTETTTTKEKK